MSITEGCSHPPTSCVKHGVETVCFDCGETLTGVVATLIAVKDNSGSPNIDGATLTLAQWESIHEYSLIFGCGLEHDHSVECSRPWRYVVQCTPCSANLVFSAASPLVCEHNPFRPLSAMEWRVMYQNGYSDSNPERPRGARALRARLMEITDGKPVPKFF